jgi:hypothetical protein
MTIQYANIAESKRQPFEGNIRSYFTTDGYTKRCGVPTDYMIKLVGENRWRRVRSFCNSNSATLFVATKTNPFLVVYDFDLK